MQNLEYAKNNLREKLRRDVSEDEFNISVDQIIEIALVEYTETLRAKAAAVHDALKDGKAKDLMLELKNDIDAHY